MTNRCRATPNTSPDSPSNVLKVLGVMDDESTLVLLWRHMRSEGRRILASNTFKMYVYSVFYAAKV